MAWRKPNDGGSGEDGHSEDGHSHANKSVLDKLSDVSGSLAYNGVTIGGNSGSGGSSQVILGGNCRFSVDFIDKKIAFTTWNMWTENRAITLSAGEKTFAEMGNTTFYYVCYNENTIEIVTVNNIGSYRGFPIFGIQNNVVFPFNYPINQIGVRGGSIYNRPDLAVGEWTIIGDSLSQGQGWWTSVKKQYNIPIVTNLAVSGKRMLGSSGMWKDKDVVSASTELCTIMGGTNDELTILNIDGTPKASSGAILPIGSTFDTETFFGAYQTLIEGLLTKNPNMKIILMTPPRAWKNSTASELRSNLKIVGDFVKEIGQLYNVPVIDMYHNMGYNEINQNAFLLDGLHFTEKGYSRVSSLVCGALRQYY